jgi:hypothetical protein
MNFSQVRLSGCYWLGLAEVVRRLPYEWQPLSYGTDLYGCDDWICAEGEPTHTYEIVKRCTHPIMPKLQDN